jgi:PTS system fructose-specific IIC component
LGGAQQLGYAIHVETQGSVGAGTPLTAEQIAEADVVLIAADREVDRARFAGKRVLVSNTNPPSPAAGIDRGAGRGRSPGRGRQRRCAHRPPRQRACRALQAPDDRRRSCCPSWWRAGC